MAFAPEPSEIQLRLSSPDANPVFALPCDSRSSARGARCTAPLRVPRWAAALFAGAGVARGRASLFSPRGGGGARQTRAPTFYPCQKPAALPLALVHLENPRSKPLSLSDALWSRSQPFSTVNPGRTLPWSACLSSSCSCPWADEPFTGWSSLAVGFNQVSEIRAKVKLVWLQPSCSPPGLCKWASTWPAAQVVFNVTETLNWRISSLGQSTAGCKKTVLSRKDAQRPTGNAATDHRAHNTGMTWQAFKELLHLFVTCGTTTGSTKGTQHQAGTTQLQW